MNKVFCSLDERYVNPLFEVFDGGDFILSSYRDIEEDKTQVQIFFEDAARADDAERRLREALEVVGVTAPIQRGTLPDEDWRLSYRRHFTTECIGRRLMTVPVWELEGLRNPEGREVIVLDPGLAFGTGKHETTRACLTFIEELSAEKGAPARTFLDMGTGSGILSIAAAKLGYARVTGFDVDEEAVKAAQENCEANGVKVELFRYGLGAKVRRDLPVSDVVVANILGPLLIRFADEIVAAVGTNLVISGILTTLYPEVLAAFVARGFREVKQLTFGEWTTGLLVRQEAAQ